MMNHQLILNEALSKGLDLIGERWTLLILREAFYGCVQFEQFRENTGISRATLTRRLTALVEQRVFLKVKASTGKRLEYHLAAKGLDLLGASLLALQWESQWRENNNKQSRVSKQLTHRTCNSHLMPITVCRHCNEVIRYSEIDWLDINSELESQFEEIQSCQSRNRKRETSVDVNDAGLINLIGDRWSMLILIACFFNTQRYDEFIARLNISTSILASRLKMLVDVNVLSTNAYMQNPLRHNYVLTDKGKSLFPFVMVLRQWVCDNLVLSDQTQRLVHKPCGQPLELDVVCGSCFEKTLASSIVFRR